MVEGKRKPLSNGFRQMVECCIMTRVSWDSLRNLDSCLFVSEIHCDRRQHPGQKNMQITHIVAQGLLDPLNSSANAASFPILKLTNCTILSGNIWDCARFLDNVLKKLRKTGVKVLKQRTILFKLVASVVIEKKGANMSNRVLNRVGARELTPEEAEQTAGGTTTGCRGTSLHKNGPIIDVLCDPN